MPEAVLEEAQRRYREMPNRRAGERWASIPFPELVPAFDQVLMDLDGHLWMREYQLNENPLRVLVFGNAGRWLGTVQLPEGGQITDVGSDYVLGVWTDALGIETVRMYGLAKPEQR